MEQKIVEQPKCPKKDKILLANDCVFSQQQFLGSKGAVALANEEVSGVVDNVYKAMDEYALQEMVSLIDNMRHRPIDCYSQKIRQGIEQDKQFFLGRKFCDDLIEALKKQYK